MEGDAIGRKTVEGNEIERKGCRSEEEGKKGSGIGGKEEKEGKRKEGRKWSFLIMLSITLHHLHLFILFFRNLKFINS